MKVKFRTTNEIELFKNLASKLDGDVFIRCRNSELINGKDIDNLNDVHLDVQHEVVFVTKSDREKDSFVSELLNNEISIFNE